LIHVFSHCTFTFPFHIYRNTKFSFHSILHVLSFSLYLLQIPPCFPPFWNLMVFFNLV
jgi:hypothetical protein